MNANPEYGRPRLGNHAPQMCSCLMACIGRFLIKLHFMACLNWLLQRVGSNRVAGASAKAPDSGERPWASAAGAPGAEQVTCLREQASPVTSRTHRGCRATLWIYFSPDSDVTGATLSGNSRNLVLQRLCRVCLFFVVPGCARASSSSSALVRSSCPFTKRSLDSGGMVPRIWNNIWRFSGCPSAGPQSKARDTRATYLRLYGGCSGCCCVVSCWAACRRARFVSGTSVANLSCNR